MKRRLQVSFLALVCWMHLQYHGIDGFLPFQKHFSPEKTKTRIIYGSSNDDISEAPKTAAAATTTTSSCPFSKRFPKYRIDFTKVDSTKNSKQAGLLSSLPLVGNLQKSLGKKQLEQKFQDIPIQWLDDDVSAIQVFTELWKWPATLSESGDMTNRAVLGLTDTSHFSLVQHWIDILDWMQHEKALTQYLGDLKINATIHSEQGALVIELTRQGTENLKVSSERVESYDPASLTKRTQSWVKRILVDQGICPFTKSVKVSGQGLGDLGIPVAKIHYCSSNASRSQTSQLMAGTFSAILLVFHCKNTLMVCLSNGCVLCKIRGRKYPTCLIRAPVARWVSVVYCLRLQNLIMILSCGLVLFLQC